MTQPKSNLPASIHRRRLDGARQRGEDFQLTLLRFGAERLLYRLGRSAHAREFVQPAPRAGKWRIGDRGEAALVGDGEVVADERLGGLLRSYRRPA